jgi:hypothetical protein
VATSKTNNIRDRLNKVLTTLDDQTIANQAFKKFKDVTPIRSGNAKRKTKLQNNTINADYPYAEVLDKGRHMTNRGMRGSDQAPEGMTKPTIEHIRDYVYQKTGVKIK